MIQTIVLLMKHNKLIYIVPFLALSACSFSTFNSEEINQRNRFKMICVEEANKRIETITYKEILRLSEYKDFHSRCVASTLLGKKLKKDKLHIKDKDIIHLIKELSKPDSVNRYTGVVALAWVEDPTLESHKYLYDALDDEKLSIRELAAKSISKIKPLDPQSKIILYERLNSRKVRSYYQFYPLWYSLYEIDPDLALKVSLNKINNARSKSIKKAAIGTLRLYKLGSNREIAVSTLINILKGNSPWDMQESAANALNKLNAIEAIPDLERVAKRNTGIKETCSFFKRISLTRLAVDIVFPFGKSCPRVQGNKWALKAIYELKELKTYSGSK